MGKNTEINLVEQPIFKHFDYNFNGLFMTIYLVKTIFE